MLSGTRHMGRNTMFFSGREKMVVCLPVSPATMRSVCSISPPFMSRIMNSGTLAIMYMSPRSGFIQRHISMLAWIFLASPFSGLFERRARCRVHRAVGRRQLPAFLEGDDGGFEPGS